MLPPPHIRWIESPDDPAKAGVLRLYCSAFAEAPYFETHHPADVEQHTWRRYAEHGLVVAEHGSLVVGFACCLPLLAHPDTAVPRFVAAQPDFGGNPANTVYMAELAVDPIARGLGLGARLVDARLARSSARGLGWYVMRTDPDQSLSARIYRRRGARTLAKLQDLGETAGSRSRYRRFYWGATGQGL
jgi:GNAT superfamily N-acetyltransferase